MRRKKTTIALCLGIVVYCYYLLHKKATETAEVLTPSYVVLTAGNPGLKLYSEIKSTHRQKIFFSDKTVIKSKALLPLSSSKSSKTDVHYQGGSENGKHFHLFIWNEICGSRLTSILHHPLFPDLPSEKHFTPHMDFNQISGNTAMYVFGLITPKVSGSYYLQVTCTHVVARLQLSLGHKTVALDCQIGNVRAVDTGHVQLKVSEHYYVSVVLKTDTRTGSFSFKLKLSDRNDNSKNVGFFLPTADAVGKNNNSEVFRQATSRDQPLLQTYERLSDLYTSQANRKRSQIYNIPFMREEDTQSLFPTCDYSPSYIMKKKLSRYMGQWETHYTSVYPPDETDIPIYYPNVEKPHVIFGNPVLDSNQAYRIVNLVMDAIKKKHKKKYVLETILSVEQNKDDMKGSRYLVELELKSQEDGRFVRFSEYVFQPNHSPNSICYPKDFSWNKNADVNYILTSAGQSRWVLHFINTMSRIYNETQDTNMNVIIVDFGTSDVDLAEALRSSMLKRYTLLKRKGKFHKTLAIQDAAATILNPDAIALQVDLHLTIPSDFTDHIRKHTVKGKMAYSPLLTRLQCGATPQEPSGFWEVEGYGIFGIYKSDWDRIGGMNVRQFRSSWGGEDWELLDSVLNHGYEVERLKIKNFNHIFHTKKKMWNSFKY